MSLRTAHLALSAVSNLALIVATVAAFVYYTTDAGIVVGAFCLTSLTISSAVLSLHFRELDTPAPARRRPRVITTDATAEQLADADDNDD